MHLALRSDIVDGVEPPRSSMQQRAVQRIRELIVEGTLPPGRRLQEQALSDYLGISRTPVREAFRVLAAEGLVVIRPHRGAEVRAMGLEELMHTFQVIASLDALAGELAAANATEEEIAEVGRLHEAMLSCYRRGDLSGYFKHNQAIHSQIVSSARNPVLSAQLSALNAQVQPYRFNVNREPDSWRGSIEDHEVMLAALRGRDAQALREVLRNHLPDKFDVLRRLEELRDKPRRGRRTAAAS